MSGSFDIELITHAIQRCVKEEVEKLIKEKTDEIFKELCKRVDRIALEIASMYTVIDYGHEIRITVKKEGR